MAAMAWGVGFLSWAVDVGTVEWALEHDPRCRYGLARPST
jgi:hypothetical protein